MTQPVVAEPVEQKEVRIRPVSHVELAIRETFPEQPNLMVEIARCESGLKPDAVSPTGDYGLLQINLKAHGERLEELGLDPLNLQDNLTYARMLYDNRGTDDWYMSEHCWS